MNLMWVCSEMGVNLSSITILRENMMISDDKPLDFGVPYSGTTLLDFAIDVGVGDPFSCGLTASRKRVKK